MTSSDVTLKTRKLFSSFTWSCIYAAEIWTFRKADRRNLEALKVFVLAKATEDITDEGGSDECESRKDIVKTRSIDGHLLLHLRRLTRWPTSLV